LRTRWLKFVIYYSTVAALVVLYILFVYRGTQHENFTIQQQEPNSYLIRTLGYHHFITFSVEIDYQDRYHNFTLLESYESPFYASPKDIYEFFSRLEGKTPEEISAVDVVTGATVTCDAILAAILGGSASPFTKWRQIVLLASLWGAVVIFTMFRSRRILLALSIGWFIVIGIFLNIPVTVRSVFSLAHNLRLLPFFAVVTALLYTNTYCSHVCPFGFLQRLAGRLPGIRKRGLPQILKTGKYILFAVAFASFLAGYELYLEPYALLFSRSLIYWVYLFPAAMLGLSFFIPRFWCRGFCPMGAVLTISDTIRNWSVRGRPPGLRVGTPGMNIAPLYALLVFGLVLVSNVLLLLYL
jgi:hypothetical protein